MLSFLWERVKPHKKTTIIFLWAEGEHVQKDCVTVGGFKL